MCFVFNQMIVQRNPNVIWYLSKEEFKLAVDCANELPAELFSCFVAAEMSL
jgi:hypothetical protein